MEREYAVRLLANFVIYTRAPSYLEPPHVGYYKLWSCALRDQLLALG